MRTTSRALSQNRFDYVIRIRKFAAQEEMLTTEDLLMSQYTSETLYP